MDFLSDAIDFYKNTIKLYENELTLKDSIPQEHKDGIDMARDYLRRASVLVVCGSTMDEAMKNDIAVAERLRITATTLDGILTVKGQGREDSGKKGA